MDAVTVQAMATWTHVAYETLQDLKSWKEERRAASFDDGLHRLIMTHRTRTMPLRGTTFAWGEELGGASRHGAPRAGHFYRWSADLAN